MNKYVYHWYWNELNNYIPSHGFWSSVCHLHPDTQVCCVPVSSKLRRLKITICHFPSSFHTYPKAEFLAHSCAFWDTLWLCLCGFALRSTGLPFTGHRFPGRHNRSLLFNIEENRFWHSSGKKQRWCFMIPLSRKTGGHSQTRTFRGSRTEFSCKNLGLSFQGRIYVCEVVQCWHVFWVFLLCTGSLR